MMFAKMHFPEIIPSGKLDSYLAMGWFRMRQTIFTTNFLYFGNRFYSAVWLRVGLEEYEADRKELELLKKNAGFRVTFQRSGITEAQEALFSLYRESVDFEAAEGLQKLLYGSESHNRYDTHTVSVYDGDLLVAVGFFDVGKTSAAGITSVYHPSYKKNSLGKFLIYQKIAFCRKQGLQYFYPGYMVPGYAPFEYKVHIGKKTLEWLELATQKWLPYTKFTSDAEPLKIMLKMLETLLEEAGVFSREALNLMYYRYFDVRLDPSYNGIELFDFPVFLYCMPPRGDGICQLIVYDVRDSKYHLLNCSSILKIGFFQEVNSIFSTDLLKVDHELVASPEAGDVLEVIGY